MRDEIAKENNRWIEQICYMLMVHRPHVAYVDDAALCCTHLRANVRGIGAGHKLAQKTIQFCTLDVAIACGQTERECV